MLRMMHGQMLHTDTATKFLFYAVPLACSQWQSNCTALDTGPPGFSLHEFGQDVRQLLTGWKAMQWQTTGPLKRHKITTGQVILCYTSSPTEVALREPTPGVVLQDR